MEQLLLLVGTAFWFGLLTSISPCSLATNIAAVSYIGNRFGSPRRLLLAGLLFTLGRLLTYVLLATILVASLLAVPDVALFLQRSMNKVLGPLLIVVGLVLTDILPMTWFNISVGEGLQKRAEGWGIWGAGVLGLIFALSFCPISAGLFFGSLIPMAVESQQAVLLPIAFGIGTALPVVGVAVLLAFGVRSVAKVFNRVTSFERVATRLTGVLLVLVGGYYVWEFLLKY